MRSRYAAIFKFAVTTGLLGLLLWRLDFHAIAVALGSLSFGTWLVNFLLFIGANFIATAKWKLLLRDQPFLVLLKFNFVGQYFALLLPGQVAGEVVKAYRLGKGRNDAERIAASIVIDRITGFLGLLGIALTGVALTSGRERQSIAVALFIATAALVAVLFSSHLRLWTNVLNTLPARVPCVTRISGQLLRLLGAWREYARSPRLLLTSVALGGAFQLVAIWINQRIGSELGVDLALSDWCWIFGVVSIATALPFTIGGLGLREFSFVGTLALLNVTPEKALALSLGIFSLLLAGAAIGGILDWMRASPPAPRPSNLAASRACEASSAAR